MREGRIVRTLEEAQEEMRREYLWPTVMVDSWQFGKLPVDQRLRQLAIGYSESAKRLCRQLGEQSETLTWPLAAAVCFCYRHAVELFLKSCILHRVPEIERCTHDISSLRDQYFRLYPYKEFEFQTPYDLNLEDIEALLGGRADREDFETKHDQVYRYLSDKQGRSPKGSYNFAPGVWLSMIERLEDDINRVWENIRELDGKAEPGAAADGGDM
jgi:hypothetical protein